MASIRTSVRINAPRERAFEVFTDLRSAPERISAIDSLEVVTDGPVGPGTRFRETRTICRRPYTETMEVSEWNPPESYAVVAESHGARYHTVFSFRADGEATDVEVVFAATPVSRMAKLMSFMSGLMLAACRKAFEKDLAELKAAIERENATNSAAVSGTSE